MFSYKSQILIKNQFKKVKIKFFLYNIFYYLYYIEFGLSFFLFAPKTILEIIKNIHQLTLEIIELKNEEEYQTDANIYFNTYKKLFILLFESIQSYFFLKKNNNNENNDSLENNNDEKKKKKKKTKNVVSLALICMIHLIDLMIKENKDENQKKAENFISQCIYLLNKTFFHSKIYDSNFKSIEKKEDKEKKIDKKENKNEDEINITIKIVEDKIKKKKIIQICKEIKKKFDNGIEIIKGDPIEIDDENLKDMIEKIKTIEKEVDSLIGFYKEFFNEKNYKIEYEIKEKNNENKNEKNNQENKDKKNNLIEALKNNENKNENNDQENKDIKNNLNERLKNIYSSLSAPFELNKQIEEIKKKKDELLKKDKLDENENNKLLVLNKIIEEYENIFIETNLDQILMNILKNIIVKYQFEKKKKNYIIKDIYTNDEYNVKDFEDIIKNCLKILNFQIEDSIGQQWFMTGESFYILQNLVFGEEYFYENIELYKIVIIKCLKNMML